MNILKRRRRQSVHVQPNTYFASSIRNNSNKPNRSKRQLIKSVAVSSTNFFFYPKLIGFLLFLTLALLVSRVYYSNQLAVSGARVSYSNSKLSELQQEKYDLENQLSAKSSLGYIDAKAQELGLVKVTRVEVIKSGSSVALNQ